MRQDEATSLRHRLLLKKQSNHTIKPSPQWGLSGMEGALSFNKFQADTTKSGCDCQGFCARRQQASAMVATNYNSREVKGNENKEDVSNGEKEPDRRPGPRLVCGRL